MKKIWKTIRGYIWWTHPRGNIHYDIMVTVILLFIFVTPHYVNFNDKPAERQPRSTAVQVMPEGSGFVYRIDARAIHGTTDAEIRADLLRVIEPISGEVKLSRYEAVPDLSGHIVVYMAWVQRR